jgi:internalin A
VKQTLLDYKEQDEARVPAERQYRTISYTHFQALCDAQGGHVSSARELLRYLHHTGIVYYQEHLFNQQIILDQRWAIEAIYTIFHREKSYPYLKRQGGRFRLSDLDTLFWKDRFSQAEQWLFLTFMQSCALCFRLSEQHEDDPEYLAPDLLPSQETVARDLCYRRATYGHEVLYYRYTHPFLHQGTMRRFTVHIGRMFRDQALYWKDGVFIDLPGLQAMAIIEGARGIDGHPSRGRITLEVRGKQRQTLLNRLRNQFEHLAPRAEAMEQTVSLDGGANWVEVADLAKARLTGTLVSQQGQVLDAHNFLFLLSNEPGDDLSEDAPYAREEVVMSPANPAVYISYAWGDSQETGASREDIVNRLYDALIREGYNVKRDKMDLGYKGLISAFMQAMGRSDCIVVVISDTYLKSPFCMYELLEMYRHLQFDERICPIVLSDARLRTLSDRLEYVAHWQAESMRLKGLIDKVGWEVLSASGSLQEYEKYREITFHADKLLTHLADINSQTPERIAADDFDLLRRAIDARLHQLQSA